MNAYSNAEVAADGLHGHVELLCELFDGDEAALADQRDDLLMARLRALLVARTGFFRAQLVRYRPPVLLRTAFRVWQARLDSARKRNLG